MKTKNEKTEQLKEAMYQDSLIHFALNPSKEDVMVNATEMAKIFEKRVDHFTRSDHAKKYIKFLSERTPNGGRSNKKIVDNRGHVGIYFHRKLAIKFAMWLDDEFFDWVIDTIDEILHGKIEPIKNSFEKIKTAEQKLNSAIEKAKRDGNKDALAIIEAFEAKEIAKSNKIKAMKLFSKQISMDL
jgi:hypothetical protein